MRAQGCIGSFVASAAFIAACSGSSSSGFVSTAKGPSDHLYVGVVAGVDGTGAPLSGTVTVFVPNPANDAKRPAGAVVGQTQIAIRLPGASVIAQTSNPAATYSLMSAGYTINVATDPTGVSGTYRGPAGAMGAFAALDLTSGNVRVFCGTYAASEMEQTGMKNSLAGSFDEVIDATGRVSGVFAGSGIGTLAGSLDKNISTVMLNGTDATGGGSMSGSATGDIDAQSGLAGSIMGTFAGSLATSGGAPVMINGSIGGTFTTDTATCERVSATPSFATGSTACSCDALAGKAGCLPCGLCCVP